MSLLITTLISIFILLCDNIIASNNNDIIDKTNIDILLQADLEYIDKSLVEEKLATEKGDYEINIKVYIINKTGKEISIPDPDDNLRFYVRYRSTEGRDILKDTRDSALYFHSTGAENIIIKANSYIIKEFKYLIIKEVIKQYVLSDDNNIFQGFCEYMELIRSNKVNIPMIKKK